MNHPEIMEQIKVIAQRLKKEYRAEKVILYGSYARGDAHQDSDVDLLIIAATKEKFFDRIATVNGLIRDLRNGLPVSPVVLTPDEVESKRKKRDPFINDILDNGIIL